MLQGETLKGNKRGENVLSGSQRFYYGGQTKKWPATEYEGEQMARSSSVKAPVFCIFKSMSFQKSEPRSHLKISRYGKKKKP